MNSRPPVKPAIANEPFKHVIDEYKHQAQTITCTCGWHGSSATIDRGGLRVDCPPVRGPRQEAMSGGPWVALTDIPTRIDRSGSFHVR